MGDDARDTDTSSGIKHKKFCGPCDIEQIEFTAEEGQGMSIDVCGRQ
jgi:hypothetical protein